MNELRRCRALGEQVNLLGDKIVQMKKDNYSHQRKAAPSPT